VRRYAAYLWYVARHKWFVLVAGWRLGIWPWALLWHDLSKLRLSELVPYAHSFYDRKGRARKWETKDFDLAVALHVKRNPHHWGYWTSVAGRSGGYADVRAYEIPDRYLWEMVADWFAASRAKKGTWTAWPWYLNRRENMILHPDTQTRLEVMLKFAEKTLNPGGPE
jgi:hypothetical protein